MSAIEEHSTRDLFDGTLPRLQESLLGYQLPGPVENVRCFEDSDNFGPDPVPHKLPDAEFTMFDMQEQIDEPGERLDGFTRSIQPKQDANDKWKKYSFNTKPVFYRCRRRGRIQYYCNYNQSNEVSQEERQVLQPTFRQSERSSTHEEENQSDAEGTTSQLRSQKNATTNSYLLRKMKPTRTSEQARVTPRNPNQKPRQLRMSNQLNVLLLP